MKAEGETASGKSAPRAKMLHQFQAMTSDERIARSDEICASVFDSPAWQKAQSVVLFSPLRTEPQIGLLEAGAVTSGKSTFIIPSTMGVETQLDLPFSPELILLPRTGLFAFGHRLGRGGGSYDRVLSGCRTSLQTRHLLRLSTRGDDPNRATRRNHERSH